MARFEFREQEPNGFTQPYRCSSCKKTFPIGEAHIRGASFYHDEEWQYEETSVCPYCHSVMINPA